MEQNIHEKPAAKTKPRNSLIVFLLSLFLPGLGQVYNGQPKKGAFFLGLILFFPLLFGVMRWTTFFYGLLSFVIINITLIIYIIIDGVRNAKQQQNYVLKPYNTWYYHLLIAVGVSIIFMIYDIRAVLKTQTFNIPSPANNPTLQIGDYIVADMKAYHNKQPDYGDIVVYSRTDGQMYVFRVVGRPNDKITLINNVVSVNNKQSKATFIKETTSNDMPVLEFEEELPNGHKHLIYKNKPSNDSTKANIKNIVVPSDSYYLLGDSRDNATDSRYEGFISIDRIKGKVVYSYFGKTTDRINIDFRNK